MRKLGHLGTLDPGASGVLPLAINGATKRATALAGEEKLYEFDLCLGAATDTDDDQGRVTTEQPAPVELMGSLERILPDFVGERMQRPPRFSAVSIGGRRAYDLARCGVDFELDPRPVRIDSIGIVSGAWPSLRLQMACRSGTYVRSLCRDLGAALGCGGHARAIRRLRSGPYIMDMAVTLGELGGSPGLWIKWLMPMESLAEKSLYS